VAAVSLAQRRFNAGLTPEELGEEAGVSGRTVRRLEDGTTPTVATAKKLADFFKVQPSDIWPIDEAPTPNTEAAAA
jgi:DNA-binding XRE family transcriptional regulator